MTLLSTLAAFAMAFGAPLVYADQAWSIQKRRSAEGFSKDVCAVLLVANVCRVFFWFGERFEWALLLQSVLMIVSQVFLLSLLLKFRPGSFATQSVSSGDRSTPPAANTSRTTTPASRLASAPQATADFSADDAFDGPGGATSSTRSDDTNGKPFASLPSAGGLFSSNAPSSGRYAPLFGLQLPAAPTLGLDDDDDDDEAAATATTNRQRVHRAGRKTVRFLQAGLKRSAGVTRQDGSSGERIFGFWTWPHLSSYLLFLAALAALLTVLQLVLGGIRTYVWLLGMFALGLESTLPVPQALKNYQRGSLSGFRLSVLLGWLVGDAFKSVYFIMQSSPIQFVVSGLFALSVDLVICAQLYMYRAQTQHDEEEQRTSQAEELEAGRRREAPIEDAGTPASASKRPGPTSSKASGQPASHGPVGESSPFQIEADDDDDDDDEGDMGRSKR